MKPFFTALLLLTALTVSGQTTRPATITDTEKLVGLSTFWSEAKYNFAYFDKAKINWDSAYAAFIPQVLATKNDVEYYRTMERFCALLKDGHTNIFAPPSLRNYAIYTPFLWVVIDQKPYITHVLKGLNDNVPVGSELLTINNVPVRQYLDREVFPYISASAPHEKWNSAMYAIWTASADTTKIYPITLRTPDGKVVTNNSRLFSGRERNASERLNGSGTPLPNRKLSNLTMLPGDIARVELNSFGEDKIVNEFKAMLPQLRSAKGIIIDLRQNGGGNTGVGTAILNYFTTQKKLTGSAWRTREHRAAYKAWGSWLIKEPIDSARLKADDWYGRSLLTAKGDYWYKAPVINHSNDVTEPKLLVPTVVLAGNGTGSAAEDFLIFTKQLTDRKIPIIGEPSTGSTGQPLQLTLPGGGSARICTKRDTYADGTDFVGIGVLPDIAAPPTVADLVKGRDTALERAITYLNQQFISQKK